MLVERILPMDPVPAVENGPLDKKFGQLVEETLDLWHVPGMSVAVVDGEKLYAQGYGTASLQDDTPVTSKTLFFAGSTTKAFTAAIMSFLVSDNENYPQIQWNTPIHQILPSDFVLENEYATTHTTIEDALSHRSGLPRHDQAYGATASGKRATIQDMIRSMRHLPLTAEPRTKYQYCNLMFTVATHIIQTVTGSSIGDLMKECIWEPLGMECTYASLRAAKNADEDLARGYYYSESEGKYHEVEWMELDQAVGAGNVVSNVVDYAKWARAIMKKETPISKEGLEELLRPRTFMPLEEPYTGTRAYSLGWRTGVYHGHQFYEHTGGMNAFGAEFILFPDINFSVVAFANTAGTSNFAEQVIAFGLVDEKLGVPVEKRFDWNKQNQNAVSDGKHKAAHAKSIYFPNIPSPALPSTLPLSSYAGKYYHPAYQNLTILINKDTKALHADRSDSTWPEHMSFEHVSGDFFVITSNIIGDLNALFPQTYPAEFRVGSDGKVIEVGIGWEPEMGEEKIWLKRKE